MASEGTPSKSSTFNKNWTAYEEEIFIQLMVEEIEGGRRAGKSGFQKAAFNRMAKEMKKKLGNSFDSERLHNKHKAMKRQYSDIIKVLKIPGFSWCPTTRRVMAEAALWDDCIKGNPRARQLRNKSLPDKELLDRIFEHSGADGDGAIVVGEEPLDNGGSSTRDIGLENGVEDTAASDLPKRKRKRSKGTSSFAASKPVPGSMLSGIAEAVMRSAEAFKEALMSFDPVAKKRNDQGVFDSILEGMLEKGVIDMELYEFATVFVMEDAEKVAIFLLKKPEKRVGYLQLLMKHRT